MAGWLSGERVDGEAGFPLIGALRNGGRGEVGRGTAVGEGRVDCRSADLMGMGGGGGLRRGSMGAMGGAVFGALGEKRTVL
jgi:hypothetical protein